MDRAVPAQTLYFLLTPDSVHFSTSSALSRAELLGAETCPFPVRAAWRANCRTISERTFRKKTSNLRGYNECSEVRRIGGATL